MKKREWEEAKVFFEMLHEGLKELRAGCPQEHPLGRRVPNHVEAAGPGECPAQESDLHVLLHLLLLLP